MYKVDCIIPAFNVGPYVMDAVESIRSQSIGFSNIRIVVVDDGSTDDTQDVCMAIRRLFGERGNIVYLRQDHQGAAVALNTGLDWVSSHGGADFICFLDADDMYERTFMQNMCEFLESSALDAAFCAERNFERGSNLYPLYSQFVKRGSRVYSLRHEAFLAQTVCAGMFRTECLTGKRFDPGLRYTYELVFATNLLRELGQAGFVSTTEYLKRKRVSRDSLSQLAESDPLFCEELVNSCKSVYDGDLASGLGGPRSVSPFSQSTVVYELVRRRLVDVLATASEASIARADTALRDILAITSDSVIEQNYVPYWLRQHFLILKHGSPRLGESDPIPRYYYGTYPSVELISGTVSVMQISEKNGRLRIRGYYIKPSYDAVELVAQVGERVFVSRVRDSWTNDRKSYLGEEYMRAKDFDLDIQLGGDCIVQFFFRIRSGKRYAANLSYEDTSRFAQDNSFFVGDEYIVSRSGSDSALRARSITEESIYDYVASQGDVGDPQLFRAFVGNFFEFRKRRIWLFMDRRTNIDDNAEALFRYAVGKRDGIEKFYVVPDASYMPQFEGVGWTVVWNSFEFRLLLLFAEKFISSHTFEVSTTVWASESENQTLRRFVNRFSNVDFVFLQHGITKENVSNWLNAYRHDISLLVTAAEPERQEFLHDCYGYGPSVVKLTGFPRYDRLTSQPEKMILFMPTFFKPYTTFKFDYSDQFRRSDYFRAMNEFINDQRLLEALKAHGYRFCFKLHEEIIVQRADFDIAEGVEVIDKEVTFNELFSKASLMITDYTSAVFDFAYLRKPVIYYQAVPNIKYPDGYFDYRRDGFGDVICDQAEMVDKVIEYMESGCVMEPEYVRRVEGFFKFGDRKNSARVYAGISKLDRRFRR
ncbi:MAG: bifunctional glycosyltransferase family 2 protein/CDP-glycerol:glycerophosphate glycerophosphotransferase [Propionibacteriaceae bacterium]|nr:bifunctional glycosyltransferase family 2 protein/CDP-glycerol:glycerophosphate glycerophosphotransferase [Propionibacteriaceae bacterium]